MSIEPWNTGTAGETGCEDMPRKFIDIKFSDYPVQQKRAIAPFSCLPARTGPGSARKWVKGLVPCGFSGQRPVPPEGFLELISAIFKVHLSLFLTHFFIAYLTLPLCLFVFIYVYLYFSCLFMFILIYKYIIPTLMQKTRSAFKKIPLAYSKYARGIFLLHK